MSIKKLVIAGLTLVLLLGLVANIAPAPTKASPEVNIWKKYPIPLKGAQLTSNVTIPEQTGVTAITVAFDGTLYAATEELSGTPLGGYDLFKSTDDGYTWTPLWEIPDEDKPTGGPASDPNPKIIALVLPRWEYADTLFLATQYNVYKSTDGGENFTNIGRPAYGSGNTTANSCLIKSLDVTYYNGKHSALVGSSDNDTFAGDYGGVYLYEESRSLAGWLDLQVGGGAAGTEYDVPAAAFSPDFADDQQVIALITDDVPGSFTTKVSFKFNGLSWNGTVGDATLGAFASSSGCIGFPPPDYESLAYPEDVDLEVTATYLQYVGVSASDNSSVYLVKGVEKPSNSIAMPMGVRSAANAIHSLAVTGNGIVIAGLVSGGILRSGILLSYTPPSVTATANNTCIALGGFYSTGYVVYAGTSGNNSGFARSVDSGATFARTSFICDDIISIVDLAVSPSYGKDGTMYMITMGSSGNSILWRTTNGGTNWDAVLTAGQVITLPSRVTRTLGNFDKVALSPQFAYDPTVFICESGTSPEMWRSTDNGFRFLLLATKTGTTGSIDSWAIFGRQEVLVGDSLGTFYRTTDVGKPTTYAGKTWSPAVATGLSGFSSMALSPDYGNDTTILAGDDNGRVYISKDDGEDWQALTSVATGLGTGTLVAFSPFYADDKTVYAADSATDTGMLRFIIGSDSQWQRIDQTNPFRIEEATKAGTANITELLVVDDGDGLSTLYAAESDPVVARVVGTTAAEGGVARCLNPTSAFSPDKKAPLFEIVNTELPPGNQLSGLWYAKGSHTLWSIDISPTPDVLYSYEDTLTVPLKPLSPPDGASPERGLTVSWQAATGATSYNLWYDIDPGFEMSPAQTYSMGASANTSPLEKGVTYYWRVRVGQSGNSIFVPGLTTTFGAPALSRFSDTWSFTTALGGAEWSPLAMPTGVAPSPGVTNVPIEPTFAWNAADRATGYEFILAKDDAFKDIVVEKTGANALTSTTYASDVKLEYATTYFWRVRAVSATSYSEWAVSVFTTEMVPTTLSPPAPPSPPPPPTPSLPPETAVYAWGMIGIGSALIIVVLVLILTTKRPSRPVSRWN